MSNKAARKAKRRADKYVRALEYLDNCGDITYKKVRKSLKIAALDMPDSELKSMWDALSEKEGVRQVIRKILAEGIPDLIAASVVLGATEKK